MENPSFDVYNLILTSYEGNVDILNTVVNSENIIFSYNSIFRYLKCSSRYLKCNVRYLKFLLIKISRQHINNVIFTRQYWSLDIFNSIYNINNGHFHYWKLNCQY